MIIDVQGECPELDRPAELIAGLINAGKMTNFVQMVLDGHPVWHAICFFEEDALAFEASNRWCGACDDWMIVIGNADGIESVPTYCGYGEVECWLEYDGVPVTITPGFGVCIHDPDEFEGCAIIKVPFADDSAIPLNRAMRAFRTCMDLDQMWEAE